MKKRIGFSLIVNLTALFAAGFLFRPFWEESDDVTISLLAEGAYGYGVDHLVYSNVINGSLIRAFCGVFPSVRWHALFQYMFIFTALTSLVYVLAADRKGRILSVLFVLLSFYDTYVSLQYSKSSAIVAMASYVVLFELARGGQYTAAARRMLTSSAWICLFYSMILRRESFLLGTAIAGIYGVGIVVSECLNRTFMNRLRRYLLLFVPVFVMFIISAAADRAAYASGEWSRFKSYDGSRVALTDFHHNALLYDDHKEELEGLGLSENDAFMMMTWQFADDRYFTPELMDEISLIDQKGMDTELIKAWVSDIYNDILRFDPVFIGLVLLVGMFAAFIWDNEKRTYYAAGFVLQFIVVFSVLLWYEYSCRWSHRVVYALLICEAVLLVYEMNRTAPEKINAPLTVCAFMLLSLSVMTSRLGNEFDYQEYRRSSCDYDELISYMQQHKDSLFVTDTFTMQDYGKYDVFKASERGQYENCVSAGTWTSNSPVEKEITRKFGYENPFDALASRSGRVFLVDNVYPDKKVIYCNEHGDGNGYDLESTGEAGGIAIYSLR